MAGSKSRISGHAFRANLAKEQKQIPRYAWNDKRKIAQNRLIAVREMTNERIREEASKKSAAAAAALQSALGVNGCVRHGADTEFLTRTAGLK